MWKIESLIILHFFQGINIPAVEIYYTGKTAT